MELHEAIDEAVEILNEIQTRAASDGEQAYAARLIEVRVTLAIGARLIRWKAPFAGHHGPSAHKEHCDACLGQGNLEPDSEEFDYETCEDCGGTGDR